MANSKNEANEIVGDYKYGFKTDVENVLSSGKGLNEDVVRFISKGSPWGCKDSLQVPSVPLDGRCVSEEAANRTGTQDS